MRQPATKVSFGHGPCNQNSSGDEEGGVRYPRDVGAQVVKHYSPGRLSDAYDKHDEGHQDLAPEDPCF